MWKGAGKDSHHFWLSLGEEMPSRGAQRQTVLLRVLVPQKCQWDPLRLAGSLGLSTFGGDTAEDVSKLPVLGSPEVWEQAGVPQW